MFKKYRHKESGEVIKASPEEIIFNRQDIRKQLMIILGSLHSITPANDKCSKKELKAAIKRLNNLIGKLEELNNDK